MRQLLLVVLTLSFSTLVYSQEIRIYPWSRAYVTALEEENSAAFMTVRSKKRENLFKWVGPLASPIP